MRAHTNFQRILLSAKRCVEAELRLGTASAAVWDLCSPYFFALGSGAACLGLCREAGPRDGQNVMEEVSHGAPANRPRGLRCEEELSVINHHLV